jgi:SAM-dependent methyltransferase
MTQDLLALVKARSWFYAFELPDGSTTPTDVDPAVLHLHATRRDRLRDVIATIPEAMRTTALDLASHEGFFTVELARHCRQVLGIELRERSITAAEMITTLLGLGNAGFRHADLLKIDAAEEPGLAADFVLLFGLLYHLEDPVRLLRLACRLARRHILLESQVLPCELGGRVEDGSHLWQRDIHGTFGLVEDYSERREGGSADFALVPSVNALVHLLRRFGCAQVRVLPARETDHEQFRRGARVIIHGIKG